MPLLAPAPREAGVETLKGKRFLLAVDAVDAGFQAHVRKPVTFAEFVTTAGRTAR
jgi:hypothetical protein